MVNDVYSYLAKNSPAEAVVSQFYKEHNPFIATQNKREFTVQVEIRSIVRSGSNDKSWQVLWSEEKEVIPIITCRPMRMTDVALEPGESIMGIHAGDTVRWMFSPSQSMKNGLAVSNIVVKPSQPVISTNLHHINYEHLGTDAELDDLITLCDTCHTQIHAQDIKKKQPVDLFSLPPASEGESKIELFQLALILMRDKSLSASQKWDRYNEACNNCTPPLSVKKYADIWLQAMKVVEDWRF